MTKTEEYIEEYKKLEEVVRSIYKIGNEDSISYYLNKQDKYRKYKEDIKYCQEVRNLLQHKSKLWDEFSVEPSRKMIQFIRILIEKVKNRLKCNDIQITRNNVFCQPINGNVKAAMKNMREKMYTHIPIIEDGRVIGVFDENSVFCYLADEGIVDIEEKLTFGEIKEYCSLEGREMEEFLFFRATSYVDELENAFEKTFRNKKRIGMVFLTANGKATEELQGILTPWDILAAI